MELVKIHEELINEASKGPLAAFEFILKAAGIGLTEANGALLKSIQKINPNVKQLFKATPEEVNKAFARLEFKEYRKIIVDYYLTNQKKEIEKILKVFDLTNTQSIKQAKAEIANKLSMKNAIANDVVERYKTTKVPKPKIKSANDLSYLNSFTKGVTTLQTPTLFFKFITGRYKKISFQDAKKITLWFFSGIGDSNMMIEIFNKHGIPKALVNVSGQVFSKWLIWSFIFSSINLLVDFTSKDKYNDTPTAFLSRAEKSLEASSLHWVLPIGILINEIINPLFQEGYAGLTKNFKNILYRRLNKVKNDVRNESKKIESSAENKVRNSKVVQKIDSLKNTIIPQPKDSTTQPKKSKFDPNF